MKGTGIVDGRFTITQRAITDTRTHIDCLIFPYPMLDRAGDQQYYQGSDLRCVATRGRRRRQFITKDAVTAYLQK